MIRGAQLVSDDKLPFPEVDLVLDSDSVAKNDLLSETIPSWTFGAYDDADGLLHESEVG